MPMFSCVMLKAMTSKLGNYSGAGNVALVIHKILREILTHLKNFDEICKQVVKSGDFFASVFTAKLLKINNI